MFLCLKFSDLNLVMHGVSDPCGSPELILAGHYFWQETCQWHRKMLDLLQKYSGLERKLF